MSQATTLRLSPYVILLWAVCSPAANGQSTQPVGLAKFALQQSGLELQRRTQSGSSFDVVGHKSAVFGYENRTLEAWVYPLKILDDFSLAFRLQGYPLDIPGPEIQVSITARPEATIFTYSHAAFTVRQILFAPVDEPGIVMLLDVDSVLPMTITGSFRPRLRLEWPAGLMTPNIDWDARGHLYSLTEESHRFVGLIGSPAAEEISLMPYQEEPRDVPARFTINVPVASAKSDFIPIVVAGSVHGFGEAKLTYAKLLREAESLYENNVAYYARLQKDTVNVTTPDQPLNTAFAWAKVGVDKGIATNPYLGTGLIAGFRTSGDSERPGFAWFFGRDALWTSLALNSYGDFAATRAALKFLEKFQRADGKIPHEISQSATLIPWFTDYPYPWAAADATPLYVIAEDDYWRASGDLDFIRSSWDSIVKAYNFSAATDRDGTGLIPNTGVGTGWVEGGALYPPHQEIYLEGLWIEASRAIAELAGEVHDANLKNLALANAERARAAVERTYWLADRGFYAFSTSLPSKTARVAEPGPNGAARQARLDELRGAQLIDEDTVLPAVPLWWHELEDERAQSEIDHLGDAAMATDWGARIISEKSQLYDPLSYHYGSVWPLFTGWAAVAAYDYGRPQVGYQALMANAGLTYTNALGYVTELLSGAFDSPFGRSSHHQVWSEAMVATATLRGLLGIEVRDGGKILRFAPQLPADWDHVEVSGVAAGGARYGLTVDRSGSGGPVKESVRAIRLDQGSAAGVAKLVVALAFPLDTRIRAVYVNGHAAKFNMVPAGDVERVEVAIESAAPTVEVRFEYVEGTDVYTPHEPLQPGATSEGLRIIHARAGQNSLSLTLEGLGGRAYTLPVRTGRQLGEAGGVQFQQASGKDPELVIKFEGPSGAYVRREISVPITDRPQ